jgi:hypothetical protein
VASCHSAWESCDSLNEERHGRPAFSRAEPSVGCVAGLSSTVLPLEEIEKKLEEQVALAAWM